MTVAIVTDSGSDLSPELLAQHDIRQVPLSISFGSESFLVPDEMTPAVFWQRMCAPDSPFAHTAAPSAGQFKAAFEDAFDHGADAVVCVNLSETLSATIGSARMAAEMLPSREIHVVDSRSASLGIGALAIRGAIMARDGAVAADIAAVLTALREKTVFYVALETLEYLRKGGRISHVKAAIGGLLSTKPVMTIVDGMVVPVEQPRTRARARERLIQLMTERPLDELHILYSPPAEGDSLREELLARLPAPGPSFVTAQVIGPLIGAHVGPGVYGGVLVLAD